MRHKQTTGKMQPGHLFELRLLAALSQDYLAHTPPKQAFRPRGQNDLPDPNAAPHENKIGFSPVISVLFSIF
jgi:hypothetical protein